MPLPAVLCSRLRLPVIAAPMTGVSGPELVATACRGGVIGAFPTHNARDRGELDRWLAWLHDELPPDAAPFAPNLVVHATNARLGSDLACLTRRPPAIVITSVGSPEPVVRPLHDVGCLVFAAVATMRHVERAIAAGVDGLVLLSAGGGGQTGGAAPMAFVRAVRDRYDGVLVVAGGVCDGASLLSVRALGADLAYMGTKFIATTESRASEAFRQAVIDATLDDIVLSDVASGLPANFLRCWLEGRTAERAAAFDQARLLKKHESWSAGHSVVGVHSLRSVADLIADTAAEFATAKLTLDVNLDSDGTGGWRGAAGVGTDGRETGP